jgi:hypothetical protein
MNRLAQFRSLSSGHVVNLPTQPVGDYNGQVTLGRFSPPFYYSIRRRFENRGITADAAGTVPGAINKAERCKEFA